MKNKKYYFAYGSNMNLEQMKYRCPNSKVKDSFFLEGFELEFKNQGLGTYATVKKSENSKVPVVMWEITEQDESTLDRYEGCPSFYRKEYVSIEFNDEVHDVLIYIMNDQRYGIPSKEYIHAIEEGYISAGFDTEILYDYLKKSNMKIEESNLKKRLGDDVMFKNYNKEKIKLLKEQYKKGDIVELLDDMDGEVNMFAGLRGEVRAVDDIGSIHVLWSNGRTLGLTSVDRFKKVEQEQIIDNKLESEEELEAIEELEVDEEMEMEIDNEMGMF